MDELKYGICSTSSIAPRFISAVRECGGGKLLGVSSRTLERAEEKAKEWGIPKAYGSHIELFSDEEINVVYISSVNSEHYSMVKQALEYGKNVVCEKPCTTTSEQTKELFRLAEEKGLFLMEAQKMLFLPAVKAVKDIIFSGDMGEIKMIEFSHCFSAGYNNWLFDPTMGGGTLLSSGIYAVQLLLWLCGDIKRVGGFCSKRKGLAEHQYVINGETENGVLFSIKNSTETVLDNKAVIYGSEGKIELPEYWKARKAVVYRNGKDAEMIEYPCKYELVYEALHIAECIRSGKKTSPVVTEELSVKGIEVIEKIKADWDSFIL